MIRPLLSICAIACAAILSTGCATGNRAKSLNDVPLRHSGAPQKEQFWTALDEAPEKERLGAESVKIWPLPLQMQIKTMKIDDDRDRLRTTNFAWNDLASPLLMTFLPLRMKYTEYHYDREGAAPKEAAQMEPIGRRSFYYTPLYIWDVEDGQTSGTLSVTGKGVPLLYGKVKVEATEHTQSKLVLNNTLWTLGPAWINFRNMSEQEQARAWFVTPVLLGGGLGTLVWSSYNVASPGGERVTGHGPLVGLLGWWEQEKMLTRESETSEEANVAKPEPDGSAFSRLVLLGVLWSDYVRRDEAGATTDSRHGPLWSAFGWGKQDGDFKVRFLFIPIG